MAIKAVRRQIGSNDLLGEIEFPLHSFTTSATLYGGCGEAALEVVTAWADPPVTALGEWLSITAYGYPVFSGRVLAVVPNVDTGRQTISLSGWWKRLDELELVDPIRDRIVFGTAEDSDRPECQTVFDVFTWLKTAILADTESPVTHGEIDDRDGTSTKLGDGGFTMYARDRVGDILRKLAIMDGCVVGIDANAGLYWVRYADVLARSYLTVGVGDAPSGWKTSGWGILQSGEMRYDGRGPNTLYVSSRDAYGFPGIRTYTLAGHLPDRRVQATIYAPQIRSGQSARRLALGLFRRFSGYSLRVQDADAVFGIGRMEPHLGRVRFYDSGVLVGDGVASGFDVEWSGEETLAVRLTVGEREVDPGSEDVNDPLLAEVGPTDEPQIDTGDFDSPTYPDTVVPSNVIDFDDGWYGDGDDLHTNPARQTWRDPSEGRALDYGTDKADPSNGRGGGAGTVWHGVIKESEGEEGTVFPLYDVDLLGVDGKVISSHIGCGCWPPATLPLLVGQKVLCYFPAGGDADKAGVVPGAPREEEREKAKPVIDGSVWGRTWKAEVMAVDTTVTPATYTVMLLRYDKVTVAGTFSGVEAWPPLPAGTVFATGDKVLAHWENAAPKPILQTSGAGGSSDVGVVRD